MNFAISLKRSLSAEIFKFRSTFLLWFILIAPAFIPVINLIVFLRKGDEIVARGGTAWSNLMQFSDGPANFLFPFFVIIVALFVNQIENNANTWKLVYTQPNSRWAVYSSKALFFAGLLLTSLVLYGLLTYAVAMIVNLVNPDLGFGDPFSLIGIIEKSLMLFLASLGFGFIQFWLGQRFKNLILSLGIGVGGLISFMILVQGWQYAKYHPYGYHVLAGSAVENDQLILWQNMEPIYLSIGLAAIVFILAGVDMVRKRII